MIRTSENHRTLLVWFYVSFRFKIKLVKSVMNLFCHPGFREVTGGWSLTLQFIPSSAGG